MKPPDAEAADRLLVGLRVLIETLPAGTSIPMPKESLVAILAGYDGMSKLLDQMLTHGEAALDQRGNALKKAEEAVAQTARAVRIAEDAAHRIGVLVKLLRRAAPFVTDGPHGKTAAEASDVRCSIDAVLGAAS